MPEQKTTSFDIAYRAGVSQSTVSRALRDSPLVGRQTRERIQAIAKEMNYKVDKNASNLRSQTTKTLAVLLFEDPGSGDAMINPFFLTMIGSITRAAAIHKYDVLLSFQQFSDDWHAEYEDSNRADGVICLGYGDYVSYSEKAHKLIHSNAHFVTWGPVIEGQQGCFVGCDNAEGATKAVKHLVGLGNKKIAFLGGADEHCPEFRQRFQGYKQALEAHALVADLKLQIDADSSEDDGYKAAKKLIEKNLSFDAIFAASDLIAIGAIKALKEHNVMVPEHVAVIGFDDIPTAAYMSPPLSTVKQNTLVAGEVLVDKIILSIQGEQPTSELLAAELIVRESCGAKN